MTKNKVTLKDVEKSDLDKKNDRKFKLKEGSKADKALDKKEQKQLQKKQK